MRGGLSGAGRARILGRARVTAPWQCPFCETSNDATSPRCVVCDRARAEVAEQPQPQMQPAAVVATQSGPVPASGARSSAWVYVAATAVVLVAIVAATIVIIGASSTSTNNDANVRTGAGGSAPSVGSDAPPAPSAPGASAAPAVATTAELASVTRADVESAVHVTDAQLDSAETRKIVGVGLTDLDGDGHGDGAAFVQQGPADVGGYVWVTLWRAGGSTMSTQPLSDVPITLVGPGEGFPVTSVEAGPEPGRLTTMTRMSGSGVDPFRTSWRWDGRQLQAVAVPITEAQLQDLAVDIGSYDFVQLHGGSGTFSTTYAADSYMNGTKVVIDATATADLNRDGLVDGIVAYSATSPGGSPRTGIQVFLGGRYGPEPIRFANDQNALPQAIGKVASIEIRDYCGGSMRVLNVTATDGKRTDVGRVISPGSTGVPSISDEWDC